MNIQWRPSASNILDEFERQQVHEAARIFKMGDCTAIDSYEMSPDGPMLASVFLLNDDFIAEVKLDSKDFNCDILSIKSACNLRIKKTTVALQAIDEAWADSTEIEERSNTSTPNNLKFAEIIITHHVHFISKMGFFGEEIDEWLNFSLSTNLGKQLRI